MPFPSNQSYSSICQNFRWQLPEQYNIGVDVCDRWAESEPERIAILHKPASGSVQPITYGQLRRDSNRLANLLTELDITSGDRVAVLLGQCPETASSHIAIYKMAAIAVPLFSLFERDALSYRLANCGARVVITDRSGAEKLQPIRDQLPDLMHILVIDAEGKALQTQSGWVDYEVGCAGQSDAFTPVTTTPDTPALIIYTSGTTGQPKGALHGHRVLLGHLPGVELSHDLLPQPDDRIWTPADWAWIGGLYDVLMPALHHGVTVVSHRAERFDAEAALDLIESLQIRNLFMPPTALKLMRTVENIAERWSLKLRTIASGGEPLGSELLDWAKDQLGVSINEFYGQTECNMIVSNCTAIMPAKPGSMGRPVAGHELAVIAPDGQPLPTGEVGNIAVHRPDPVMFLKYWDNDQATRDRFVGDWMLTGDLAWQDDEGYLYFQARDDDLITSAGYRFGPGEIENCLLGHDAVKMAAVVGIADPVRTQIVKAFIILQEGVEPSDQLVEALQQRVKSRLAAHEYPRQIEFVNELPMTTTGKIIRRQLRQNQE
ncbi:acyl-CoA synthetase [Aestuariirhabdus sp. Z084]|uniref:acyl-CoA synthetase n=1 Tax=Aestuariirhabdus haliotis TaxID=2918751 RepID=UPI0020C0DFFC|nr:acyl-CoA synthetase [Aestuariirhabdus haliotis]MCL6414206.1 acyl-CoA synthetase [Aestuariirhabdus haliotis]